MPKAILLDLDDTIICYDHGVDTDSCWKRAFGNELPCDADLLLAQIKDFAQWYWSDPERHRTGRQDLKMARTEIIAAALAKFGIDNPAWSAEVAGAYGIERDRCFQLFPDSIDTIRQFRSRGIKLALLTNGNAEVQWQKIRRFELEPLFDCLLVEGEFGIGKPDERIYLHALKQLGVTAEQAWMVGDNFEWEVAAPQRLGIKGVWVDHKGVGVSEQAPVQPYMIIRKLSDLLSVI